MMSFSLIGLILLGGLVAVVSIVGVRGFSALIGLVSSVRDGSPTLTCPHCQQETTLANRVCRHCGKDL